MKPKLTTSLSAEEATKASSTDSEQAANIAASRNAGQNKDRPLTPIPPPEQTAHKRGSIVFYSLREQEADDINRRRNHARDHMVNHRKYPSGLCVHVGNQVKMGQRFPMMIVQVWGKTATSVVNGQVFLDGNDTLWTTSVGRGEQPGQFTDVDTE